MIYHPSSPLVLQALAQVPLDRLLKATEALARRTYTLRVTTREETELGAVVTTGAGKEYSVVLTQERAFCSCKDAMFRHTLCKHAAALALHALRSPAEQPQPGRIAHLMWRNGTLLCGEDRPERVLGWPWPEVCTACVAEWIHPGRPALTAAA